MPSEADETRRWQAKVAAWIHDPAEKALVLLRDPAGHEGGTTRKLREELFGAAGVPSDIATLVRRADQWSAAADRPQFPRKASDGPYEAWSQVDFAEKPELIHPLGADRYELETLEDVHLAGLKEVSFDHLKTLVKRKETDIDWRKTFLALWRLGPASPAGQLGALWTVLPADTRIPDHSIWEHLRLVSALAGAMAAGGSPALLEVSFGPVQSFIAQARSTSDLWAGSHLLSSLCWEGMRVVCECCGPDAILFPDLHGVPVVDVWLEQSDQGLDLKDKDAAWKRIRSDANPLFGATLPNRFVAIVAEQEAKELAEAVTRAVRAWAVDQGKKAWRRVLEAVGVDPVSGAEGERQLEEQLRGFPEVHWASVSWGLAVGRDGGVDTARLGSALERVRPNDSTAFLASDAWKLLSRELQVEGAVFFRPNPGTVYPALWDLLGRSMAAAKATRAFEQQPQEGYRCSLCGEREWLTTDRGQLGHARGRTGPSDVWPEAAKQRPAWVREGEHLCGICGLKRLWPTLVVEDVRTRDPALQGLKRYVLSTHTMALAPTFRRMVAQAHDADHVAKPSFAALRNQVADADPAALPRQLVRRLMNAGKDLGDVVRRLPTALDELRDRMEGKGAATAERELSELKGRIADLSGSKVEAYYALVLMDGDRLGAWLAGDVRTAYRDRWHSQIRAAAPRSPELEGYLDSPAAASPAFHAALSRSLNSFALDLAPFVVEDLFLGKVLYAGGDDLLAMLGTDDLLAAMLALRCGYSGVAPADDDEDLWRLLGCREEDRRGLRLSQGYAFFPEAARGGAPRRLMPLMGRKATASIGAVVAHHMDPLGAVLRELRAAEKRAKDSGRDAFSVSVLKRSGGAIHFTSPWRLDGFRRNAADTAMGVLVRLRDAFAKELSRRAAYHVVSWLPGMPPRPGTDATLSAEQYGGLLLENLRHQFRRQRADKRANPAGLDALAADLVDVALESKDEPARYLEQAVGVAEFLAREGRAGPAAGPAPKGRTR
jgi:CRISPR-associated protein Cmr2